MRKGESENATVLRTKKHNLYHRLLILVGPKLKKKKFLFLFHFQKKQAFFIPNPFLFFQNEGKKA